MTMRLRFAIALALGVPALSGLVSGQPIGSVSAPSTSLRATSPELQQPPRALATEILREMIEIRTSAPYPNATLELLDGVVARLRGAGFADEDLVVEPSAGGVANLVARYRGSGSRRPILLMAHIDVVDAEPDAWEVDPFEFAEIDGYYHGRGTTDNKAGAATLVANFVRLKSEGFVPDRDLIMILTGDEESAMGGIDHVVNRRRELVDAEFALNTDAGGGRYDPNGEPQIFYVQTSEKLYQSWELETTNPGGHSSVPRADNAIYELARALTRIQGHAFPLELNDGTRVYFERSAAFYHAETAEHMRRIGDGGFNAEAAHALAASSASFNAMLRTTCVATRLEAGHADNALPRSAKAIVNCRILPGHSPDEVETVLRRVIGNEGVTMRRVEMATPSAPSRWDRELMAPVEAIVERMWPGTPVIPNMSTGATDGLWVRNAGIPVYGISAIFDDPEDIRAHGLDERVGVEEFHQAVEFWYAMLKALSS